MRFKKDRSGRWLMDYHASSLMKFIKLPPFTSCRSVSADQVAPRRIPDGLFQVHYKGRPNPTPVLIEIENFWNQDAARQMLEAIFIVRLTYDVIPDAILIVLSPRGNEQSTSAASLESAGGTVAGLIRWQTIRMWEIDAEELFAFNDAGLAPWITLAKTSQPPKDFLERCKALLDAEPPSPRLEELRIVTGFFAAIRYSKINVSAYFSGDSEMIYSPLLDEILKKLEARAEANAYAKVYQKACEKAYVEAEKIVSARLEQSHSLDIDQAQVRGKVELLREVIVDTLQTRFAYVPDALPKKLEEIESLEKLKQLTRKVSQIASVEELLNEL